MSELGPVQVRQVRRTPQEIFAAQLDAWDQVVETLSADAFFARVIDSQRAWAKRVSYYVLFNNVDTKLAYEHYFGSLNI